MAWHLKGTRPTATTILPHAVPYESNYHKTSNIRRTFVGNKIVDHSDVVSYNTDLTVYAGWIGLNLFSTTHALLNILAILNYRRRYH